MSPSAEPATAAADQTALVPEAILHDGEEVILAVKPAGVFVLLVSWPAMAVILTAMVATMVLDPLRATLAMDSTDVGLLAVSLCGLRLVLAAIQWSNRLYVLTNRRVIRIRGLAATSLRDLPLEQVVAVDRTARPGERMCSLGTLLIRGSDAREGMCMAWSHLARPDEIAQALEQAIRRARKK